MRAVHLEILVEDRSMEAFLRALLSRSAPGGASFDVHPFQGKDDLLKNLSARLRAYARWLPDEWRLVVVVDRDADDCLRLKTDLEGIARSAGLASLSRPGRRRCQIVNRLAIEELEAWYFGDWAAVRRAYPRVPATLPKRAPYRDPDAIAGGTWEAFERVLQAHGYFRTGLRKIEAARTIGAELDPSRSTSRSFTVFHDALIEATT